MLLEGGCVPTLLQLLAHENIDIAADVVELLSELTGAGKGGGPQQQASEAWGWFVSAVGKLSTKGHSLRGGWEDC